MEKIKQRFFLKLAYDGTNYHGWQMQQNAVTVQQRLNESLQVITRQPIETIGAGRTDTGVHAKQLFAHFDSEKATWMVNKKRFLLSLNSLLPPDISVQDILEVAPDAHARFDATLRSYEYHIHFEKNPFLVNQSWFLRDYPSIELMNEAANLLVGTKDFSCFSKSNTQVFTNICTITRAEWATNDRGIVFHISANRFLRNMVRAIVGTLLEIGLGKKTIGYIHQVLASQNRSEAGTSVPAHGLFLTKISYPYIEDKAD